MATNRMVDDDPPVTKVIHPSKGFDPVRSIQTFVQTSPWLAIAIAVHLILGAVFWVIKLGHDAPKDAESSVVAIQQAAPRVEDVPIEEPPETIDRTAIPDNVEAELVDKDVAQFSDPLVAADEDLRLDRGDPNADPNLPSGPAEGPPGTTGGTAIGVGSGGHAGLGIPSAFGGRTLGMGGGGTGGGGKGRSGGLTQGTEKAIRDGLLWLARHQDEAGRWSGATCAQICQSVDPEKLCQPETALEAGLYSTQADVGMTSLALLTFLGAGFRHDSKQYLVDNIAARKIVIGKQVVMPGLKWLVDQQRPDGSFSDAGSFFLYNEALATLALSEAYGLTRSPYWKKPAQKAVDFICKAQKPNPQDKTKLWGWRYHPADVVRDGPSFGSELSEADMSVTGWMVMALKSAQLSGLEVPQASIDGALDFTRWSTGKSGLVGYLGPDTAGDPIIGEHDNYQYHQGTMSSIGMCVRIFLEHDLKDPFLIEGAEVLLNDLPAIGKDPDKPQTDYYYWYYGSLALNQIDGPDAPRRTNKYWGPWNKAMNETILAMQDQTKGACSYGGWMQPDRWSFAYGPVYTTAINVLTLEVYFRYANAFGMKKEPGAAPASTPNDEAPVETTEAPGDGTEKK